MIRVGMSTSCVYPLPLRGAFRLAHLAGYDGVEIMVTAEKSTQDAAAILELSREYELPILSIHAPVLPLTQLVWGRDPAAKLRHAAQLAQDVGAPTVVVHPPFLWQPRFAQAFEVVVGEIAAEHGVELAVENMFGWHIGERDVRVYSPTPDPTRMDVDAMTLDFSHAAIAGRDGLDFALAMGSRLRHIHLCDGVGGGLLDEHLIPGHGTQPVAEVLAYLAATGWKGSVVAEVHTRTARRDTDRLAVLTETLEFARAALDPNRMHYREKHHVKKAARRSLRS